MILYALQQKNYIYVIYKKLSKDININNLF